MIIKTNLFTPKKFDYVRGIKPKVKCILCSVLNGESGVDNLLLYKGSSMNITMNLYPYNPGHIMIFPARHIEDVRKLTESEWMEIFRLQRLSLDCLEEVYKPTGFNMGFNIGQFGGASIEHIHFHIVPRYKNEIGFMELFSDARIIVENPKKTFNKLKKLFRLKTKKQSV
ncbi:MAG TPA: HIT domain-containing protein [bacterium]|nr:HIT domain-containing protein [bacterium]HPN31297.1 HIT domain-containing protein [bacterium]